MTVTGAIQFDEISEGHVRSRTTDGDGLSTNAFASTDTSSIYPILYVRIK